MTSSLVEINGRHDAVNNFLGPLLQALSIDSCSCPIQFYCYLCFLSWFRLVVVINGWVHAVRRVFGAIRGTRSYRQVYNIWESCPGESFNIFIQINSEREAALMWLHVKCWVCYERKPCVIRSNLRPGNDWQICGETGFLKQFMICLNSSYWTCSEKKTRILRNERAKTILLIMLKF